MSTTVTPRQLLTITEVSLMLGVSTRQVHRLIRESGLPALRLGLRKGAAVRIDYDELLHWLKASPEEYA